MKSIDFKYIKPPCTETIVYLYSFGLMKVKVAKKEKTVNIMYSPHRQVNERGRERETERETEGIWTVEETFDGRQEVERRIWWSTSWH